MASLERKIQALGGLATYQKASKKGEELHGACNTSTWVVRILCQLGRQPMSAEKTPAEKDTRPSALRLLDVGALSLNYQRQRWIEARAIDLRSACPGVQAIDFFDLDEGEPLYDVVVLSLVVNFVGDARRRGDMVHKAARHLKPNGLLFLILPLACVDNSRYCNQEKIQQLLNDFGLDERAVHQSKCLYYAVFELVHPGRPRTPRARTQVRHGDNHNNFCVL